MIKDTTECTEYESTINPGMVTFPRTWTTFLVLILSWFPNDSRALQTWNNRSLSTTEHGHNTWRGGGKPVHVPVVPWTKLNPRHWSTWSDGHGFNNTLDIDNKDDSCWRKWNLCLRLSRRSIRRFCNYWIPPIPFQDSIPIKQWHRQFYPRFVIREAFLGVRIVMRIYCVIVLVGKLLERACSSLPPLPPLPLDPNARQSPLEERWDKQPFLEALSSMVLHWTIVGPLLEEIVYRGIGFLATYWKMWCLLFVWSSLVGISPFLGGLWICYNIGIVHEIPEVLSDDIPILHLVKMAWLDWIPPFLLLPLQMSLLDLRQNHNRIIKSESIETRPTMGSGATSNNQDHIPTISRCDTYNTKPWPTTLRRCERIVQRIVHSIQQEKCDNTTSADEQSALEPSLELVALSQQLQRVLLFLTRWKTSSLFAAAHIPSIVGYPDSSSSFWRSPLFRPGMMTIGSKDQYMYLRKFLLIFGSSLLVESRLVSQRGTIWGAVGAHMCYNALTLCRVILEAFLVTRGILSVKMTPLLLVPTHHVLEWMGSKLEQVEIKLMEEEKES